MSEPRDREGVRAEEGEENREYRRNSEAKFASPDGSSVGIGYYFDGEQVSAAEFDRLVDEKADRIRAEREGAAEGERG